MSSGQPDTHFHNDELPDEYLSELHLRLTAWQEARAAWDGDLPKGEAEINRHWSAVSEWLDRLPALLNASDAWDGSNDRAQRLQIDLIAATTANVEYSGVVGRHLRDLRVAEGAIRDLERRFRDLEDMHLRELRELFEAEARTMDVAITTIKELLHMFDCPSHGSGLTPHPDCLTCRTVNDAEHQLQLLLTT